MHYTSKLLSRKYSKYKSVCDAAAEILRIFQVLLLLSVGFQKRPTACHHKTTALKLREKGDVVVKAEDWTVGLQRPERCYIVLLPRNLNHTFLANRKRPEMLMTCIEWAYTKCEDAAESNRSQKSL